MKCRDSVLRVAVTAGWLRPHFLSPAPPPLPASCPHLLRVQFPASGLELVHMGFCPHHPLKGWLVTSPAGSTRLFVLSPLVSDFQRRLSPKLHLGWSASSRVPGHLSLPARLPSCPPQGPPHPRCCATPAERLSPLGHRLMPSSFAPVNALYSNDPDVSSSLSFLSSTLCSYSPT